ncbi:MAG: DUF2973 domain-containing protein [Microcystaceae cyanobacterium]
MLQLLYVLAFTIIAFLAVSNLIRSLITVSFGTQRNPRFNPNRWQQGYHPELFDKFGNPINEPLLVMRSVDVEDARQQLDALYHASPSKLREPEEDA